MSDPEGATPEPVESDSEYEVEEIRSSKMMRGVAYYLIKWKGYTSDYDTWEPEENLLETAEELLAEYKKAHPRKEKKETAKKEKKERGKKKKEKEDEEEVAIREDSHSPPPRKKYTKKRSRRSYSSSSSDWIAASLVELDRMWRRLAWLNEGDDSESETERKRYEESAKPSKSKKSKKNEEEEESPKSPDREATPAPEANPEPIPARSPVEVDESIPTTKRHKWISSITQLSKDQDNCITVHATQGGNAVQLSLKEAMALNHELVMQHLISRYPFRDSPSE